MKSKAPSIISADMTLTGSIISEGEVQLDGKVDGDVRAGSLTIGEDASVNGEVIAENVIVRGKVSGSIKGRQVQLASTARIEGDIVHASLSMESGAFFDGHCRHSSDPVADSGSALKVGATAPTSSAPVARAEAPKASDAAPTLDLPKAKTSI